MKNFATPITLGLLIGVSAFIAHITGYGTYWRYLGVLLALPVILIFSIFRIIAFFRKQASLPVCVGGILIIILLPILIAFAGEQTREFQIRRVCKASEPLLEALQQYKAKHGSYPKNLEEIPNIRNIQDNLGISIQQGEILEGGISVKHIGNAGVTIYLEPDDFYCVVPIQKRFICSITRFTVYARNSKSNDWYRDYIIWTLRAKE